ncbi:MAG: phosphatase PAP2 family protein [Bacilli bacterium]
MKTTKKFPLYAIIPTLLLLLTQIIIYYGSQLINKHLPAYDLTIKGFDDRVPIVPFFVVFYLLSMPWWYIVPFIVAKVSKQHFCNWFLAFVICYWVCGIIYIVFPTTITRPSIENTTIFHRLINVVYQNDTPERAINLFPSTHCFISWICYLGVRGKTEIPKWYRLFSLVFSICIALSTQLIKQHYIVDLISGILLAELVYFLVKKYDLGNRLVNKIISKKGGAASDY